MRMVKKATDSQINDFRFLITSKIVNQCSLFDIQIITTLWTDSN